VVVTVYSTLGQEGVQHGVSQTRAAVCVCDAKLLKVLLAVLPACAALKHIITIGAVPAALVAKVPAGVTVTSMDDVIALGRAHPCAPTPPVASDVAVIMYTSGTTGAPKGVVLTHANVCAAMAGLVDASRFTSAEVYMAYLPLAHIMELSSECVMFALGCAVGYGSPQTLTDTGLKLAPGCRGDAPTLKPTFMVFAPTVLDRVRQTVDARLAAAKPLKRRLAAAAMAAGQRDFAKGLIGAPPLWNALVFKKVQALIGGNVKLMICGSAPLSAETQRFAQVAFNCPVRCVAFCAHACAALLLLAERACYPALAVRGTASQKRAAPRRWARTTTATGTWCVGAVIRRQLCASQMHRTC
jgi:long-subunit acyl-CoA synthetase (AMP-forming)